MGVCFGGGKKDGGGDTFLKEMGRRDLRDWKSHHVLKWYQLYEFPNGKDYEVSFQKMNGKDIDCINEQGLVSLGIVNVRDRKTILEAIKTLQRKRTFNANEFFVFKKMERMTKASRNLSWKNLVETLANASKIKETYLNPSMLQDALDKYLPDVEEKGNDYDTLVDSRINENMSVDLKKIPSQKMRLPIKLVITETEIKNAKTFFKPVLNKIPSFSKTFGKFHTAIIVGPWWLEWTPSSLCVPRKLYSDMALVSSDIDATLVLKNMGIETIIDTLSEIICRWNTTMEYSPSRVGEENSGNCQHFVEDVLDGLGVKYNKSGVFHKYFQRIKKRGKAEMVFLPSTEFRKGFKVNVKEAKFDSHQELDDFVKKCMEVNEIGFEMDFKEEYQLLKSFDRAFWLRHFKKPSLRQFKSNQCPFKDPRETKSLITYQ